ncbi:hypothetical protein HK405_014514 [Cladochytrium tenue]|nr:hypothetical protein HK405_014514 [Cladochytrium tenue]
MTTATVASMAATVAASPPPPSASPLPSHYHHQQHLAPPAPDAASGGGGNRLSSFLRLDRTSSAASPRGGSDRRSRSRSRFRLLRSSPTRSIGGGGDSDGASTQAAPSAVEAASAVTLKAAIVAPPDLSRSVTTATAAGSPRRGLRLNMSRQRTSPGGQRLAPPVVLLPSPPTCEAESMTTPSGLFSQPLEAPQDSMHLLQQLPSPSPSPEGADETAADGGSGRTSQVVLPRLSLVPLAPADMAGGTKCTADEEDDGDDDDGDDDDDDDDEGRHVRNGSDCGEGDADHVDSDGDDEAAAGLLEAPVWIEASVGGLQGVAVLVDPRAARSRVTFAFAERVGVPLHIHTVARYGAKVLLAHDIHVGVGGRTTLETAIVVPDSASTAECVLGRPWLRACRVRRALFPHHASRSHHDNDVDTHAVGMAQDAIWIHGAGGIRTKVSLLGPNLPVSPLCATRRSSAASTAAADARPRSPMTNDASGGNTRSSSMATLEETIRLAAIAPATVVPDAIGGVSSLGVRGRTKSNASLLSAFALTPPPAFSRSSSVKRKEILLRATSPPVVTPGPQQRSRFTGGAELTIRGATSPRLRFPRGMSEASTAVVSPEATSPAPSSPSPVPSLARTTADAFAAPRKGASGRRSRVLSNGSLASTAFADAADKNEALASPPGDILEPPSTYPPLPNEATAGRALQPALPVFPAPIAVLSNPSLAAVKSLSDVATDHEASSESLSVASSISSSARKPGVAQQKWFPLTPLAPVSPFNPFPPAALGDVRPGVDAFGALASRWSSGDRSSKVSSLETRRSSRVLSGGGKSAGTTSEYADLSAAAAGDVMSLDGNCESSGRGVGFDERFLDAGLDSDSDLSEAGGGSLVGMARLGAARRSSRRRALRYNNSFPSAFSPPPSSAAAVAAHHGGHAVGTASAATSAAAGPLPLAPLLSALSAGASTPRTFSVCQAHGGSGGLGGLGGFVGVGSADGGGGGAGSTLAATLSRRMTSRQSRMASTSSRPSMDELPGVTLQPPGTPPPGRVSMMRSVSAFSTVSLGTVGGGGVIAGSGGGGGGGAGVGLAFRNSLMLARMPSMPSASTAAAVAAAHRSPSPFSVGPSPSSAAPAHPPALSYTPPPPPVLHSGSTVAGSTGPGPGTVHMLHPVVHHFQSQHHHHHGGHYHGGHQQLQKQETDPASGIGMERTLSGTALSPARHQQPEQQQHQLHSSPFKLVRPRSKSPLGSHAPASAPRRITPPPPTTALTDAVAPGMRRGPSLRAGPPATTPAAATAAAAAPAPPRPPPPNPVLSSLLVAPPAAAGDANGSGGAASVVPAAALSLARRLSLVSGVSSVVSLGAAALPAPSHQQQQQRPPSFLGLGGGGRPPSPSASFASSQMSLAWGSLRRLGFEFREFRRRVMEPGASAARDELVSLKAEAVDEAAATVPKLLLPKSTNSAITESQCGDPTATNAEELNPRPSHNNYLRFIDAGMHAFSSFLGSVAAASSATGSATTTNTGSSDDTNGTNSSSAATSRTVSRRDSGYSTAVSSPPSSPQTYSHLNHHHLHHHHNNSNNHNSHIHSPQQPAHARPAFLQHPLRPTKSQQQQQPHQHQPEGTPLPQSTTSADLSAAAHEREVLEALEAVDAASDAATISDRNTRRARAAVRHALRTGGRLDAYLVDQIIGYGSNGAVLSARATERAEPATPAGAAVAIKIIYKAAGLGSSSVSASASSMAAETAAAAAAAEAGCRLVPSEVAVLEELSRECPHHGLLRAYESWEDARQHYLVTELHGSDWLSVLLPGGGSAVPAEEDILRFFDPRRRTAVALRISPGSADLWAWGVARRHRAVQQAAREREARLRWRLAEAGDVDSDCDGYDTEEEAAMAALAAGQPLPALREADVALPDARLVRQVFVQLCEALQHLHSVGRTAHGDIKEENVLVQSVAVACGGPSTCPRLAGAADAATAAAATAEWAPHMHRALDVRLCDFGHAVRARELGERPRLRSYGTPQATPPELQAAASRGRRRGGGAAVDGPRADVFALGVLLYTLAHGPGRVPAILAAAAEAARASAAGASSLNAAAPVEFPEHGPLPLGPADVDARVDAGCVEVIVGMTMCAPEERWTLEQVLAHPWVRGEAARTE